MKTAVTARLALLALTMGALQACTEKKVELDIPALADYFPAAVGKTYTYRCDSTVPTQFGADTVVRSYRVKDTYDSELTDATGKKAFRVYRTISNLAGTSPYQPSHTFTATVVGNDRVEWQENNLRFIKLRSPLTLGYTWPGNSYIESSTLNSQFPYLANWTYELANIGEPYTVLGKTYDNTITVLQRDLVSPPGPFNTREFKQWDYSVEVYAKGVGLIYRNFDHKVWQPAVTTPEPRAGYYTDDSHRIVLRLIEHQ